MCTCDYGCGFAAAFDAVAEHELICSSRGKQVVDQHQGSGRRGAKGKLQKVSAVRLAATVGCKLDLPGGADDDQVAMRRATRVLPRPEALRSPLCSASTSAPAAVRAALTALVKETERAAKADLKDEGTVRSWLDGIVKQIERTAGVEPEIHEAMEAILTGVKTDGRAREVTTKQQPRQLDNELLAARLMVDPTQLQDFMLKKTSVLPWSTLPSEAWSPAALERFVHAEAVREVEAGRPAEGPPAFDALHGCELFLRGLRARFDDEFNMFTMESELRWMALFLGGTDSAGGLSAELVRVRVGGLVQWMLELYAALLAAARAILEPAVGMRLFTMQRLRAIPELRRRWEERLEALDVPGAHNDRYWLLFLDLEGFVFTEWMAKMKETEKCRLAGTRWTFPKALPQSFSDEQAQKIHVPAPHRRPPPPFLGASLGPQ